MYRFYFLRLDHFIYKWFYLILLCFLVISHIFIIGFYLFIVDLSIMFNLFWRNIRVFQLHLDSFLYFRRGKMLVVKILWLIVLRIGWLYWHFFYVNRILFNIWLTLVLAVIFIFLFLRWYKFLPFTLGLTILLPLWSQLWFFLIWIIQILFL